MFSYYGSKSKIVNLYPSPKFDRIIEPFAGSARYSLKYWDRDILLVDKYQVIVDVWHYLQQASEKDILGLPAIKHGQKISDFRLSEIEAAFLGFIIARGQGMPRQSPGTYYNLDTKKTLKQIAGQLYKIRRWQIVFGDYSDTVNHTATWFVDPPYQRVGGHNYKHGADEIDYSVLAAWCEVRRGQVIVCENTTADWLPFYLLRKIHGAQKDTTEAIWSNYPHNFQARQVAMTFETKG